MATRDMTINFSALSCWIVTEGMAGTENQCLGVSDALGIKPEIKRIALQEPWRTLAPYMGFEMKVSFKPSLIPPWPDLVIASGRKAVSAARYIKKNSSKTFVTFIQNPRINQQRFDLVAVPHHDNISGKNILVTDGAPNRITNEKLQTAKEEFSHLFRPMKGRRIAVCIGGKSKTHRLSASILEHLCGQLKQLEASLMITTSRRTGEENTAFIKSHLCNEQHYIWDQQSQNPYWGMLAWADIIIVTEDSTSMISEAATTGKPTYIVKLEGHSARFDRFHNHLKNLGAIRNFNGIVEKWTYVPLDDAKKIADAIRKSLWHREKDLYQNCEAL